GTRTAAFQHTGVGVRIGAHGHVAVLTLPALRQRGPVRGCVAEGVAEHDVREIALLPFAKRALDRERDARVPASAVDQRTQRPGARVGGGYIVAISTKRTLHV